MSSTKEFKLVYRIIYSYFDFELQTKVDHEDFVQDLQGVENYIKEIENESVWVDAKNHRCREQIEIKIKQVFIPIKKYVQLFK